jgi:hypothetical protein
VASISNGGIVKIRQQPARASAAKGEGCAKGIGGISVRRNGSESGDSAGGRQQSAYACSCNNDGEEKPSAMCAAAAANQTALEAKLWLAWRPGEKR